MIIHHLRAAWRGLRRNKLFSAISIGCLAIGLAVSMTIMVYVLHEHSYDGWQKAATRTFTTWGTFHFGNSTYHSGSLTWSSGARLQKADGHIEAFCRTWQAYRPPIVQRAARPGEAAATAEIGGDNAGFLYADANFFQFFSFRLLEGSAGQVLTRPSTVVLSQRAAKKYFGNTDPIGQVLLYNKDTKLEVTGIAANPPSNTEMDFDFVASLKGAETNPLFKDIVADARIGAGNFPTWFRLSTASAAAQVTTTLNRMATEDARENGSFELVALPDGHLFGRERGLGNYLDIFPYVAGLVLLLALINYMSLATARAAIRSKEVGVRKVMGAGRGLLASQFYTESTVYALLSFGLGVLLFLLFRPVFLHLLQLKIDNDFLLTPVVIASFAGLLVIVIVLSGSYPSLILSAFNPVVVLYGRLSRQRGGERVRKGFIIFQFAISMLLVLCSITIEKELHLIRHTDTGVDRENVVMIPFGTSLAHYAAFKREVGDLPGVQAAATAHIALYSGYNLWSAQIPGSDKQLMLRVMEVDNDFASLLGLKWKLRPSAAENLYDGRHIVLNENAVEQLGLDNDPIGRDITMGSEKFIVGGVLNNFNYQSLKNGIGPLGLFVGGDTARKWGTSSGGCLYVKIKAHVNLPSTMDALKTAYKRHEADRAFEYHFLDDAFDRVYAAEDRIAGLFGVFTAVAIIIACLGLFALATFAAQQRIREIGIRKVLGASTGSLGALLSVNFLKPVALSTLIASPMAWWLLHSWLEKFAIRTTLSWWLFPAAAAALLCIALATVLARSWRAATGNPVTALRSE